MSTIEGIAHGPNHECMELTLGGVPPAQASALAVLMEAKIFDAFPAMFGCDPSHVEIHIKEER